MKWFLSLIVVSVLAGTSGAVDFWLTNDPAGSAVADFTVDRNAGLFEMYVMVGAGEVTIEEIKVWAGFTPDLAEIVLIEANVGVPIGEIVLPDEAIFGATEIGLNGEFRLATLTLNPLKSGVANWGLSALQVIPEGVNIISEPTMRIVPEPGTLSLLGIGLLGLALSRRRRKVA